MWSQWQLGKNEITVRWRKSQTYMKEDEWLTNFERTCVGFWLTWTDGVTSRRRGNMWTEFAESKGVWEARLCRKEVQKAQNNFFKEVLKQMSLFTAFASTTAPSTHTHWLDSNKGQGDVDPTQTASQCCTKDYRLLKDLAHMENTGWLSSVTVTGMSKLKWEEKLCEIKKCLKHIFLSLQ